MEFVKQLLWMLGSQEFREACRAAKALYFACVHLFSKGPYRWREWHAKGLCEECGRTFRLYLGGSRGVERATLRLVAWCPECAERRGDDQRPMAGKSVIERR